MRTIGTFTFPNTREAALEWKPGYARLALARQVLAVATTRIEGAWCAYIDAVPGRNHEEEFAEVLLSGVKLPENVALAIFPRFEGVPYAK